MNINFKIVGEGEAILILHGWGSSIKSWEKVVERLSKSYRVIVPDMPGFGGTPPPEKAWHGKDYENWVLSFIKSQNLKIPIIFVGHSFGGGLAMKIAIDHPELVDKLILIGAARLYVKKSIYKRIVSQIAKFGKKIERFIPFVDVVRRVFYKFIVRERDYTRVSGVMKETFVNVIKEDLTAHIHKIKAPTLIIWGSRDTATPLKNAHFLEETIPDSRLEIIKGAGHVLHLEKPEKLSEIILDFLK